MSASQIVLLDNKQLLNWSNDLCRLGYLHTLMPEDAAETAKKITSLEGIWSAIHENPASQQNVKTQMNALYQLDSRAHSFYSPYFDPHQRTISKDLIKERSAQFLQEASSSSLAPITKTKRGFNGPTCIVNYSKKDSSQSRYWTHTAVFKWTSKEEKLSGEVYRKFSASLPKSVQFQVPKSSFIDFDEKIYVNGNGILENCSKNSAELREAFHFLTQLSTSTKTPDTNAILLSEKIPGSILFDFARGPYQNLNIAQKQRLFSLIGALSLGDLIFRQSDRLIPFDASFTDFSVKGAANLGNLMIVPPKNESDFPLLYAIDNDIFDHEDMKTDYPEFFSSFISDDNISKKISDLILKCVINALQPSSFLFRKMKEEEIHQVITDLQPFLVDLETLAGENIQAGIEESIKHLQNPKLNEDFLNIPVSRKQSEMIQQQILIFQRIFKNKENG